MKITKRQLRRIIKEYAPPHELAHTTVTKERQAEKLLLELLELWTEGYLEDSNDRSIAVKEAAEHLLGFAEGIIKLHKDMEIHPEFYK